MEIILAFAVIKAKKRCRSNSTESNKIIYYELFAEQHRSISKNLELRPLVLPIKVSLKMSTVHWELVAGLSPWRTGYRYPVNSSGIWKGRSGTGTGTSVFPCRYQMLHNLSYGCLTKQLTVCIQGPHRRHVKRESGIWTIQMSISITFFCCFSVFVCKCLL
jgi:hypothetical protein